MVCAHRAGDHAALADWDSRPDARLDPTPEHYLPLLYALGGGSRATLSVSSTWRRLGLISMTSVLIGATAEARS
jgi:aromatic ring-opening dioxygenase catalytic subunit (LigB family)